MDVTIAEPKDADRLSWERLFEDYRKYYNRPDDAAAAQTVWSWIIGPGKIVEGRIARSSKGRVVGLVHFRDVPRPLNATRGGYIDDMFVDEKFRGDGIAEKLVEAVLAVGRSRGWADVRWVTSEDNARARGFYQRVAEQTQLLTYQISLKAA